MMILLVVLLLLVQCACSILALPAVDDCPPHHETTIDHHGDSEQRDGAVVVAPNNDCLSHGATSPSSTGSNRCGLSSLATGAECSNDNFDQEPSSNPFFVPSFGRHHDDFDDTTAATTSSIATATHREPSTTETNSGLEQDGSPDHRDHSFASSSTGTTAKTTASAGEEIACPPLSSSHLLQNHSKLPVEGLQLPLSTQGGGRVHLLGLALDARKLLARQDLLFQLLELNCVYQVDLLISSRHGHQQLWDTLTRARQQCYYNADKNNHNVETVVIDNDSHVVCAQLAVIQDPDTTKRFKQRVERIAHLRDNLKESLRSQFYSSPNRARGHDNDDDDDDGHQRERLGQARDNGEDDGAIIVVDLDLHEISSNDVIVQQVNRILHDKARPMDVICANGLMHHPFGYYDIFATVLDDGTFVYPLSGRLVSQPMTGENRFKIRSNYLFDIFNQDTLLEHFAKQADPNNGIVPVRSCFGGLAIYRRSTYLESPCNYTLTPEIMAKYKSFSNLEDKTPCEHVVFHDCLRNYSTRTTNTRPSRRHGHHRQLRVGIQTSLVTWWDKPYHVGSLLTSGGNIGHGLVSQDGLVRSRSSHHNEKTMIALRNGNFRLYIDHDGTLTLDDTSVTPPVVKWRLDLPAFNESLTYPWEYAFLTLNKNGSMILTHQYPHRQDNSKNDDCFGSIESGQESVLKPCRRVVWESTITNTSVNSTNDDPTLTSSADFHPVLHLGRDGVARIVDLLSRRVLWQTSEEVASDKFMDWETSLLLDEVSLDEVPCIPSGTDQEINEALKGPLARAILCQGAVFHLNQSIRLTSPGQAIFTQGFPTEKGRAILRLNDPSVTVAVSMLNSDFAQIRNIVVDGNRDILGSASGQDYFRPLIQAGGRSHGQIVANITAMNTRSWTSLHFIEGDTIQPCTGAKIEHNDIGPSGYHELGQWADGISCACHSSWVRWNRVVDATDVALVQFGGNGTIVEGNEIHAITRSANVGISLVDYDPYNGDFSGTIIRQNIISASKVSIGIGIAVGTRIWKCGITHSKVVRNGIVTGNIVRGENIHFGFAVDGVANWTMVDNMDATDRTEMGKPVNDYIGCRHAKPFPAFSGFLINPMTSQGKFQQDFHQESDLEFLIGSIIGLKDQAEECIESGNQDAINAKLSGPFAKAILCPGSTFNLTAPVVFTAPYQAIYTKGKPDDEANHALLILSDSAHATAVDMKHDYCTLSHVVVDGNRGDLGPVKADLHDMHALIQAGGENHGQLVQNIVAKNTRSWATIHVAEGDPGQRCHSAVVQDSTFAFAGDEQAGLLDTSDYSR